MKNMGKNVPTSLPSPPTPQFPLTSFPSSLFTPQNFSTPQVTSASIHPAFKSPSNETATLAHDQPAALDLSNAGAPVSKRLKLSPELMPPQRSLTNTSPSPPGMSHQNTSNSRSSNNSSPANNATGSNSNSNKNETRMVKCRAADREEVNAWTVEQVCDFVRSIDICAEYVEVSGSRFLVIFFFCFCLFFIPFTFHQSLLCT